MTKPDQSKELERPETTGADISTPDKSEELISLLDEYIDQLDNTIQSLKDQLERKNTILTNARAEEGRLNADIKFKKSQIKELRYKAKQDREDALKWIKSLKDEKKGDAMAISMAMQEAENTRSQIKELRELLAHAESFNITLTKKQGSLIVECIEQLLNSK